MNDRPVATICRICKENCGILVSDTGRSLNISGNPQHPISKGFVCFKGKNFGDVHYSPHRLRTPLLKKRTEWVSISYENAIDVLAEKFQRTAEKYGPQSVAFYKGESVKHQEITHYMSHLSYAFGSPNYISVGSLCHYSMAMAHSLTYGGMPKPDFARVKTIVVWGANPANASPLAFSAIKKAVGAGAKLVVIDPARTRTAELADVHLPITPGSDGFLAFAFLKHAVENLRISPEGGLATGWDDLCGVLGEMSVGELQARSGIDRRLFDEAAGLMFGNLPGWIVTGLGLELQQVGVQAVRAVSFLQSLLDPLNRPFPMAVGLKNLPGREHYPVMPVPIGAAQAPVYVQTKHEAQGMFLGRAIMNDDPYPVRTMLVVGGNPMITFPAWSEQKKMLEKLDFLAVFDPFMTQTASLADMVLPASNHLENLELHDYGQAGKPYLGLIKPAVSAPIGWPTWKLVFRLARRLGLEQFFPFDENRDAIAYRLSGGQVSLDELENSPGAAIPYPAKAPSDRWFTPDGNVQYRSKRLEEAGYPGVPNESCLSVPFTADSEFPLWLSTGDRILAYQHSQFRQITKYKEQAPEAFVELHPEAATGLNVGEGERVSVVTRFGRMEIRIRLSEELRKDCIRIPHGWDEANANSLTGLEHFDPISGFPWLRAIPARLEKREA